MSAFISPSIALLDGFWREIRGARNQLYACIALNAFLALPIILFVHRYIDDYGRSVSGFFGWSRGGRPFADLLLFLLNFGSPVVGVAPLYQILSVIVISVACVFAARTYGISSPWWTAIGTAPLLGQPYFLENLSYGFDCISMSLALALSVIAAVTVDRSRSMAAFSLSVLLLLVALALYQPSVSGFIPFGLMLVLASAIGIVRKGSPDHWLAKLFRVFSCYSLALAMYGLSLLTPWVRTPSAHASKNSQLVDFDASLPNELLHRSLEYWQVLWADWAASPAAFPFCLLILVFACAVWWSSGSSTFRSSSSFARSWLLLASLVSVTVIFFLSPGALLLLKYSFVSVPRTLVFVGPLICSMCLQILAATVSARGGYASGRLRGVVASSSVALLTWFLIMFSFSYGHVYLSQSQFESGRISRLIGDIARLQEMPFDEEIKYISFVGEMPKSPVLQNTERKFPLVDRLVPRLISNDWSWGNKQLRFFGLSLRRGEIKQTDLTDSLCHGTAQAMCTSEHSLEVRDETVLVRLK